jgi:replicative DNA helicase
MTDNEKPVSKIKKLELVHGSKELANLRVPPQSVEAEQSVIGVLLMFNEAWELIDDALSVGDFYRFENAKIFAAIGVLIQAGKPADVITVFEQLSATKEEEACGGLVYLNALSQSVVSAANVRRHAEIVREKATLRELIATNERSSLQAFHLAGRSVAQILDESETQLLAIAEKGARIKQTWDNMSDSTVRLIDRVVKLSESGAKSVTGVATGFYDLDRMTAGLQAGDLVILAARPSMGKTAMALNIAENVAVDQKLPVLIFSMEMGTDQLVQRLAGSLGRVDQQNLRTGALGDDEWSRLAEAVEKLGSTPIFIDASAALSPSELRARARRKARQCGQLGLIVIDYLQLMSPSEVLGGGSNSSENRATVLGEITRGLKALAKELGCPVIALSQLNRSVESRNDKRPMMSDLRESEALEQDADTIVMLYRDEYYNKESSDAGIAEANVVKQRNGPTGTVRLGFQKAYSRFVNLGPQSL